MNDRPSAPARAADEAPRVPHVYVIILGLLVVTALASLVVPGGAFVRDADGRPVPGSFRFDAPGEGSDRPGPAALPMAVLSAPLRGMVDAADIIAFLVVIGGAFRIIDRSGAFRALVHATVRLVAGRGWLVIPLSMCVFSIGGAVFGMSEEVIPFVLIFVPLARALGYPPVIGVAIPLVGAGMGFAGAMLNPFTIGVAQPIAGLPFPSGVGFRTGAWLVLTAFGIGWVLHQAARLRDPARWHEPEADASRPDREHAFALRHAAVLAALAAGIAVMVWGIGAREWYVIEIGAVFLGVGLVAGLVARLSGHEMARAFTDGARDLLGAAIVVGAARGIVLLAGDLRLLDPTLHGIATVLGSAPPVVAASLMFAFQSMLNFFVPSGSGQAALTMPIMAPLADLVGVTREVSVLAFQFGDGFSNLIIPTSAVLMGSLEAGHVTYEEWFRFSWRLQVWLFLLGAAILTTAVIGGFGA
ncbi:MAG: YfcC family protein [Acidobacteriota bacterium]